MKIGRLPSSVCSRLYMRCSRNGSIGPVLTAAKQRLAMQDAGAFEWDREGEDQYAAYWTLFLKYHYLTPKWTVMVSEPSATVFAPITGFRGTFPLLVVLGLLVVLFLGNVEIRRILTPLRQLQAATARIGRRDFGEPVSVTSHDEFRDLGSSFNRMALRVQQQFGESERLNTALIETGEALKANEARLRTILDSSAGGIVTFDPGGMIDSFNRTAARMFGCEEADIVGRPLTDLIAPSGNGDDIGDPDFESGATRELFGRRRDGETFPIELALREAQVGGQPIVIGFVRDLSERKAAEEERKALEHRLMQAQKMESIGTLAGGIRPRFQQYSHPDPRLRGSCTPRPP